MPFQVLVHHRDNANRKITCNATPDLEKANSLSTTVLAIPAGQPGHIFDALLHSVRLQLVLDNIRCKNVACCAVFPAWYHNRDILLGRSDDPAVFGVDLIILLQVTAEDHLVKEFMREISLSLR